MIIMLLGLIYPLSQMKLSYKIISLKHKLNRQHLSALLLKAIASFCTLFDKTDKTYHEILNVIEYLGGLALELSGNYVHSTCLSLLTDDFKLQHDLQDKFFHPFCLSHRQIMCLISNGCYRVCTRCLQ